MTIFHRDKHTTLLACAAASLLAVLCMASSAACASPPALQRTSADASAVAGEEPPGSLTRAYPLNSGRLESTGRPRNPGRRGATGGARSAHAVTGATRGQEPTEDRSWGDIFWPVAGAGLLAFLALVWVYAGGLQRLRWRKQAWSASRPARPVGRFREGRALGNEQNATSAPQDSDRVAPKIVDRERHVPYTPSFASRSTRGEAVSRGWSSHEATARAFGERGRLAVEHPAEHDEELADDSLE